MQDANLQSIRSQSTSEDGGAGLRKAIGTDIERPDICAKLQEAGWPTSEEVESAALDANTGESAYGNFVYVRRPLLATSKPSNQSGRGFIGKSAHTAPRRACQALHNTLGGNAFKTRKQSMRQNNVKQYKKLALQNAFVLKHNQYTSRQAHRFCIQYHDHDSVELKIDEESCALCAMGIPLRKYQPQKLEPVDRHPRRSDFWESMRDALPDCSTQKEALAARPLPLDQLSYVRLAGGPTGNDTLSTTCTCKHCGYALDRFVDLASLNAAATWVVADKQGTFCNHYDCYVRLLQDDGIWAPDLNSLMAILASRDLFGYTIRH